MQTMRAMALASDKVLLLGIVYHGNKTRNVSITSSVLRCLKVTKVVIVGIHVGG
jgi:hypothetical protein